MVLLSDKHPINLTIGQELPPTFHYAWVILCASHVLVLPRHVGLGIVHGFCFGLPFVTQRADNHGPEVHYLRHGYNGYYVDNADISGLAKCLTGILVEDEKREVLARNALRTAEEDASIHLMISRMAQALNVAEREKEAPSSLNDRKLLPSVDARR